MTVKCQARFPISRASLPFAITSKKLHKDEFALVMEGKPVKLAAMTGWTLEVRRIDGWSNEVVRISACQR
jgi:hypothetical protein